MTIPKDEETSLRANRTVLEAISKALKFPVYPSEQNVIPLKQKVIPPSERIDPGELAERVEILRRQRDHLLEENAKLLGIVHQLLNQIDQRRHNGRKGGVARSQGKVDRDSKWRLMAAELRRKRPGISDSEAARKIKKVLSAGEAERTIREVIKP